MSLDLDAIRKRLAATAEHDLSAKPAVRGFGDGDAYSECGGEVLVWSTDAGTIPPVAEFIAAAPGDIAALLDEVETLRSEIAPWQTLVEKLNRQNDRLLSEVARCCRALAATAEENTSLDANLKDCVNFMRDLWPVIGVDLNALRLEPDRAAAIETVRAHTAARRSSALIAYLRHDRALGKMDLDSPEADALRDAMDPLWTALTAEEVAFINNYREGDV